MTQGGMPPRSKSKKTVRRRKSLTSAIDVGTSIVVANATTKAFFGTNAWEFFTAGWFGRPNASGSWNLSLNELVMGAISGGATTSGSSTNSYGMSASWAQQGVMAAVQKNLRDHGAQAVATVVIAPVAAKLLKRAARAPIRDMNKLLKTTGISSSLGVKI